VKIKMPDGKIIDEQGRECVTLRDFLSKNPNAKYIQYPHYNMLISMEILSVGDKQAFVKTNGNETTFSLDYAEYFLIYDHSR